MKCFSDLTHTLSTPHWLLVTNDYLISDNSDKSTINCAHDGNNDSKRGAVSHNSVTHLALLSPQGVCVCVCDKTDSTSIFPITVNAATGLVG